jgi:glutamate synthase domain-containing protein 2
MVVMSRAEAEAAAAVTRRVFEPETGRTRLVKASGEIVEEIVSKRRQSEIRHRASTTPAAAAAAARTLSGSDGGSGGAPQTVRQYTGRDKFPTQHPWFGMK